MSLRKGFLSSLADKVKAGTVESSTWQILTLSGTEKIFLDMWEDCFSLGNGQALKGHDHTTYLFVFPRVTQHGALSK